MADANLHVTFDEETELKQTIKIDGEIEHSHGFSLSAYAFVLVFGGILLNQYDAEIRCALGNQKVCATMTIPKSP